MLRLMTELYGYTIRATDGDIGTVQDFYFDDQEWTVRYVVDDTGKWLPGRRVLISPASLCEPNWVGRVFPVTLTRDQVENSPSIDAHKPVSRQHEIELARYYAWPAYWPAAGIGIAAAEFAAAEKAAKRAAEAKGEKEKKEEDPHLRSAKEVARYHIEATDGQIGHVEDFIVDDADWVLRYLVVDTRNWLPGKKVLVAPLWILRVDWRESRVYIDLSRDKIKDSPPFDPSKPVNRGYEEVLYDYYGRPYYWRKT